jgi:hypothetical protein
MKLSPSLKKILLPAYPCPEFDNACKGKMRWAPKAGHIPRGFSGACGKVSEVELVLVFAEPGNPHPEQRRSRLDGADDYLDSAFEYSIEALRNGKDLFHKNVRKILDACWPSMPFEEQLRKTWLTESVLCSAPKESGPVPRDVYMPCGQRYLLRELARFRDALIVAVGTKARDRLQALGVKNVMPVGAASPPGCNKPEARESWEQIRSELSRRRRVRAKSVQS